jgi:hypothetical protein
MLRAPATEISNEIIIDREKDKKRLHPIKIIAELIRKQNNI